MSDNPFVLPGMGQDSDLSGNPLLASMEMMRQAWAGLAGPNGLGQALPLTPPLNVEDLDRRIADLRTVEGWLRLNLQMLSSTIQGMEVQRSTITTLRSFVDSMAGMSGAGEGEASPLEIVLGLKPAPRSAAKPAAKPASPPQSQADAADAPTPDRVNAAAQSASQAWWDLLNQQFSNIAAATAASMPGMTPEAPAAPAPNKPAAPASAAAPAKAAAKPAAKPKATPRKTAAKKAQAKAKPAGTN